MFIKKKKYNILEKSISELNKTLQEGNFLEISYILGNKKEMLKRNLIAGIFRGVGIGIGVTIITAILIILLQKIVSLNIPVIGEYIADIVDIVQRSRWTLGTLHFERYGHSILFTLALQASFRTLNLHKKIMSVRRIIIIPLGASNILKV